MATKRYSGIISALGTAIDYQNLILVLSLGASGEGSNVKCILLGTWERKSKTTGLAWD